VRDSDVRFRGQSGLVHSAAGCRFPPHTLLAIAPLRQKILAALKNVFQSPQATGIPTTVQNRSA
jgi:hypothetical protein